MEKFLLKLSEYTEKNNYLAFSLIYIFSGILILIYNNRLITSVISIILCIMLLMCIKDLINILVKKKSTKLNKTRSIVSTIIVIFSMLFMNLELALITMIFGIYFVLNGIIKFIQYILIKMDKVKGHIYELIESIITFSFGILCFFSPFIHMKYMLYIIGIYLILLGIEYFFDFLDQRDIHINRIRIPLPYIVDAIIPFSVLQKINKIDNSKLNTNENEPTSDLEILVHVSNKGSGRFGHVDMCYKDKIISYGGYDKDTRKLKDGIGSGVVFEAPKNKYIKFCCNYSEKTLFVFGIKLNEKQKIKVENELNKIKEDLYEWIPPYVKNKDSKINEDDYKDYVSMLYKSTKAKFYKFKTGKMKTFFIMGNNCGTLVDKILRKSGANVLNIYGFITPGTYYEFLEKEYMKKKSNVISKKIYNKNNISKLK